MPTQISWRSFVHPEAAERSLWFCTWIPSLDPSQCRALGCVLGMAEAVLSRSSSLMGKKCFQGPCRETLNASQGRAFWKKGSTHAKALRHEAGSPLWNGVGSTREEREAPSRWEAGEKDRARAWIICTQTQEVGLLPEGNGKLEGF